MSNLTENLRGWRKDRNITKANYLTFVENVLEELLEPLYIKKDIEKIKSQIMTRYFSEGCGALENIIVDAIQDIQVFCINETELMGYDNIKCNKEVFNEINSREQCPIQYQEWQVNGANGKWKKDPNQKSWTMYEANYESCRSFKNDRRVK